MTEQQKILDEIQQYQEFLEIPLSEEVELVILKGNELAVIIARTGYLYADAKRTMNEKMQSEVMESLRRIAKETPLATSRTVNALIDSLCMEERYAVDWIERLNKSATHQLEYCRTLISLAKQERYSTRTINT
ncbi:MAG: hypothetical protein WCR72_01865 [Bacteroidota bacterium]